MDPTPALGSSSLTEFPGELFHQKQQSAEVRYPFHTSNSFGNYNGSFWDGSFDNEIIMFFDNVM